jgi:hypothetical protein
VQKAAAAAEEGAIFISEELAHTHKRRTFLLPKLSFKSFPAKRSPSSGLKGSKRIMLLMFWPPFKNIL